MTDDVRKRRGADEWWIKVVVGPVNSDTGRRKARAYLYRGELEQEGPNFPEIMDARADDDTGATVLASFRELVRTIVAPESANDLPFEFFDEHGNPLPSPIV